MRTTGGREVRRVRGAHGVHPAGLVTALGVVAALLLSPVAGVADLDAQDPSAPGPETCAFCHQEQAEPAPGDPHRLLGEAERYGAEGGSCVYCHGNAAEHVDAGGGRGNIDGFGADMSARAVSETCLSCHAETHPRFFAGEHAQAGLSCVSCHQAHPSSYEHADLLESPDGLASADPGAGPDRASALCIQCHQDVAARFDMNERHRLEEGNIGCTSCHDPHDLWAGARLGGFSHERSCLQCHTSTGGPFVFEHDASRVEGCVACHDPHGSANRHLLSFQDQGQLCYSCHVEMPGFHLGSPVRFGEDANCTNCHTAIHGSNLDPYFLR